MMIKIGDFRLAPRPRYIIEKEEINVTLRDSAAGGGTSPGQCSNTGDENCTGAIKNREIVFQVRCIGNGDLAAATNAYNLLQEFLDEICGANRQDYFRQIRNETPREYSIVSAYIKDLDLDLEYECVGIKTGEVHLFTADEDTGTEIAMFGYTVN
jgi:hypothetical protein